MIEFRDLTLEDRAQWIAGSRNDDSERWHFVVSSWTQSYRDANTAGLIQEEDWYPVMDRQVDKALVRPDVRTILASLNGTLLGFITVDAVENPPLVYYVYSKLAYRRAGRGRLWAGAGLARRLFDAAGVDPSKPFNFVCSTKWERELARKIPLARWRPLYGRFPKHERRAR